MRDRNNSSVALHIDFRMPALSVVVSAAAILVIGGLFWAQLPPHLAVHFSLDGAPNGWLDKSAYLAAMALITLVVCAGHVAAFVLAGTRGTTPRFAKTAFWALVCMEAEFLILHLLVVLQNLDTQVRVAAAHWCLLIAAMVATQSYAAYLLVKENQSQKNK